jgi:hypothetical protein
VNARSIPEANQAYAPLACSATMSALVQAVFIIDFRICDLMKEAGSELCRYLPKNEAYLRTSVIS